ncbi:hypothetical protein RP726_06915 [Candidatus Methylospira mobilis]|uniref:hypothetical protein n=1 Tax=Candidatus Methylospira mobilis TaxID=1808979 RepID=UPI0028EC1AF1|nr:hypothetical protein [Candidatus Methylospira mobilis]WNV06137.1 hypothetical protein RP726_06915 [Candidatus Methylospira mobilis]
MLHDDPDQAERFEKVLFHNIDAKQIPLTSEENLRLILDEGEECLFDDKTLLESPSFGPAYYRRHAVFLANRAFHAARRCSVKTG